jgi:hypothetical protein
MLSFDVFEASVYAACINKNINRYVQYTSSFKGREIEIPDLHFANITAWDELLGKTICGQLCIYAALFY